MRCGGVPTIAREATGACGHVRFLTLREAGCAASMIPPPLARPIKGRPPTDRRDCPWIQRRHQLGLLPRVCQPDAATPTRRDYVRQRANRVRRSGQHIQRLPKALALMNRKRTKVRGDITGGTGRTISRALRAGQRDPDRKSTL